MPTTLKRVIYGQSKDIDFGKFNIGNLTKAIAEDLEEFGQKGVQGVAVSGDVARLITYEKSAKRAKQPYIQAGTSSSNLLVVVRDKKDSDFEALAVAVKNFEGIRAQLAKNTAAVTNLDKGDDVIDGAAAAQADKHKTTAKGEGEDNYGEITGNLILCAHGRPAAVPSGRIVGDQFGKKTPDEIVQLLTGSKDPKKRIGKDYNGVITLSGCFTASGGPEASKQDDAFAAKVLSLLRGKGYSKASVVGMPGPSITARTDGDKDSAGDAMKRGDKHVLANIPTTKEYAEKRKLEAAVTAARTPLDAEIKAFNATVDPYNRALAAKKVATPDKLAKADADLAAAKATLDAAELKYNAAKTKYDAAVKALDDSGLVATVAHLKGTFGLRAINV